MIRKILPLILLVTIVLYWQKAIAQQVQNTISGETNYKQSRIAYGVSLIDEGWREKAQLGVQPDDGNTTYIYQLESKFGKFGYYYYPNTKYIRFSIITLDGKSENYRYQVKVGDSIIKNWSPLPEKYVKQDEKQRNYFLETTTCNENIAVISLYDVNDPSNITSITVSTITLKKPEIQAITRGCDQAGCKTYALNGNVNLNRQAQYNAVILATNNLPLLYEPLLIKINPLKNDTIRLGNQWEVLGTPKITNYDGMPFDSWINKAMGIDISHFHERQLYSIGIPPDMLNTNGNYKIIIVPVIKKQIAISRFPNISSETSFKLKLPITKQKLLINILIVLIILLLLFVAYLFYKRRKHRQRLKLEKQRAKESQLRLQSVRAQLNPHFTYNALAGIQNLLNKNDTATANNYLTKFSRLSRHILENADKDLITIADEITLLDDYLQMEQLRFGFKYTISSPDDIDKTNVEIPSMLLQPFVENAVKHAMPVSNDGNIRINFTQQGKTITISVQDNGKGFVPHAVSGTGSTLSANRISLLNEVYKSTPVILDVQSNTKGTIVELKLNNWLA